MLRFVFCDFLCKPYATAVEYFSTSWTRYSDERMQKLEVYMEDDALENSVTSILKIRGLHAEQLRVWSPYRSLSVQYYLGLSANDGM